MIVETWEQWLASREAKRENLRRYGCDAPSRRRISFNTAERRMLETFGGSRVPPWASAPAAVREAVEEART